MTKGAQYCTQCGSRRADGEFFCASCGGTFPEPDSQPSPGQVDGTEADPAQPRGRLDLAHTKGNRRLVWGALGAGAVLVVFIGVAWQARSSPARASAAAQAVQGIFDGYGNDQVGLTSKQATCQAMFVGFDSGTDPSVYWQGIATMSGNTDVTPQVAREALADRCAQYVDTSYVGPDLAPPALSATDGPAEQTETSVPEETQTSASEEPTPTPRATKIPAPRKTKREVRSLDPCDGGAFPFKYALSIAATPPSPGTDEYIAVSNVQRILRSLGYQGKSRTTPIAVDGWFGQHTRFAVRNFQRDHGIDPVGTVYTQTWAALGDAC